MNRFGIICWEVLSVDNQPWRGVDDWMDLVIAGRRPLMRPLPPFPAANTAAIVHAMEKAWGQRPTSRPTATELKEMLHQVIGLCGSSMFSCGDGDLVTRRARPTLNHPSLRKPHNFFLTDGNEECTYCRSLAHPGTRTRDLS